MKMNRSNQIGHDSSVTADRGFYEQDDGKWFTEI
jgi:hypothetical protein